MANKVPNGAKVVFQFLRCPAPLRHVAIYNRHIPQRALGHVSPAEALQEWQRKKPELVVSDINNLPGLENYTPSST